MPRISPNAVVACVSALAGATITVLLASLFTAPDPELQAAEQRYRSLSATDARRVQATFAHLQQPSSSAERKRIQAIHDTVQADAGLDAQLTQLYDWWSTRSDAQRVELRELQQAPTQEWVATTRRQYLKTNNSDKIELSFRGRRGPGRSTTLYVSKDQITEFLEMAVPDDGLPREDAALLKELDPADQPLARVVMFPGVLERSRHDGKAGDRVVTAVRRYLLSGVDSDQIRQARPETAGSLLRAIKDYLSVEFFERHSVSDEMIERQFTELGASERVRHMVSDSAEAADALRAMHSSDDPDSPVSQLASRLADFDNSMSRLRSRRGPPDGERGGPFGRGPDGWPRRGRRDRDENGPSERDGRGRFGPGRGGPGESGFPGQDGLRPNGPRPGFGGPGRRERGQE